MLKKNPIDQKQEFVNQCTQNLREEGWWASRGSDTVIGFDLDDPNALAEFADHWDNLLIDKYMNDGGTYRYRRYSALRVDTVSDTIEVLPHAPYEQSKRINPLNGGMKRHFEPIQDSFLSNEAFQSIILNFTKIFSEIDRWNNWVVKLHPYRIVAREEVPGEPAPEGLHKDGADFIVSYMVQRKNISGGVSSVTDNTKTPIGSVELNTQNDFVVADDRLTYHSVSPIEVLDAEKAFAFRDVLVMAFERD